MTFFSRAAVDDELSFMQYIHFAKPQHCSMKLSSQWNFGKKITLKPHAQHEASSTDSTLAKSG
jgi:hypothetical protein